MTNSQMFDEWDLDLIDYEQKLDEIELGLADLKCELRILRNNITN